MSAAAPAAGPGAVIRSKNYRVLLVMAAVIGVLVSFASWCVLELVHWIQQEVYKTLPSGLGLHPVPWWWPLPVLGHRRRADGRRDRAAARPRRPYPV